MRTCFFVDIDDQIQVPRTCVLLATRNMVKTNFPQFGKKTKAWQYGSQDSTGKFLKYV